MYKKYDQYYTYMRLVIINRAMEKSQCGFTLDHCRMSGTIFWYNKETEESLYATPFWEGEAGIPWVFYREDENGMETGEETGMEPFEPTFDSATDIFFYFDICYSIMRKHSKVFKEKE